MRCYGFAGVHTTGAAALMPTLKRRHAGMEIGSQYEKTRKPVASGVQQAMISYTAAGYDKYTAEAFGSSMFIGQPDALRAALL